MKGSLIQIMYLYKIFEYLIIAITEAIRQRCCHQSKIKPVTTPKRYVCLNHLVCLSIAHGYTRPQSYSLLSPKIPEVCTFLQASIELKGDQSYSFEIKSYRFSISVCFLPFFHFHFRYLLGLGLEFSISVCFLPFFHFHFRYLLGLGLGFSISISISISICFLPFFHFHVRIALTESYFIITHTKLRSFQFISFHCILCHSILRFGSTVSHLRRLKDRMGGVLSVQNTEIMMCHSCFPRHNNMFPHSGLRPQASGLRPQASGLRAAALV